VNVQAATHVQDVARLVATLSANLPALLTAQIGYGKRLVADMQALADASGDLAHVIGDVGAHATACVGAATAELFEAQASIRVTVQVSASVSGRVGAAG
jgi:hypothetical protein